MALSWSGVVNAIFSIHIDLRQMDPWIAEFNERLGGQLEQLPPDVRARVTLIFFIALSFRQPLHPNMSSWLERVRGILESETRAAERALLRQHLVTYHILRGEHAEAEAVLSMLHYANNLPAGRTAASHADRPCKRSHGCHACGHGRALLSSSL